MFPNYTFTFDIQVQTPPTSKYKLADGYPKVSPISHPGVISNIVGTVVKITNATSTSVSVNIKVEALWVLKDPAKGGSGPGSGGSIAGSATANVILANSDVIWVIPEPIVVHSSPEFGEVPFETSVVDTNGFPLTNWTFNSYSLEDTDPQNANWEITDLGQMSPAFRRGIVRSFNSVKGKIEIGYNDGNFERRKSEELASCPWS